MSEIKTLYDTKISELKTLKEKKDTLDKRMIGIEKEMRLKTAELRTVYNKLLEEINAVNKVQRV